MGTPAGESQGIIFCFSENKTKLIRSGIPYAKIDRTTGICYDIVCKVPGVP